MNKWLFRPFRPALLSRLGHIIVVQVIFVFAAFALILFFPHREASVDFSTVERGFRSLAQDVAEYLVTATPSSGTIQSDPLIDESLSRLVQSQTNIMKSSIYLLEMDGGTARVFDYTSGSSHQAGPTDDSDLGVVAEPILRNMTEKHAIGRLVPISLSTDRLVYAYCFELGDQRRAVMVAALRQELLVSNRDTVLYGLLLLFLGSILVSLLTVYLISQRFRGPLKRLEHGLAKTAAGELFYLLEEGGDAEVNRLVASFNQMSKTLWKNHQALKRYNQLLKDAYFTQTESQVFLATLIDCSPCCVVAATSEGEVVIFNRKAGEVFGYENGQALGLTINELFATSRDNGGIDTSGPTSETSGEVVCQRQDGSMFPAYLVVSKVSAETDRLPVHLFIFLDISESKNFQEMMVSIDRYYTRGEMAGDIAHEINNYLAVLGGNIELMPLFLKRGDQEKINKKLELMKTTVDKIARFSDGLMDINQGESRFEPADLNQLTQNIMAFLMPQNRFDGVHISTDLSSELPLVQLDPNQIQQTLVNLIQNAADALADCPDNRRIVVRTELSDDKSHARVVVSDNGPGVDSEHEGSLFEKRFTTKRKGHGYGLVTCKRIIDAHNGNLRYQRTDTTEFLFDLPIKHAKTESEISSEPAATEVACRPV
ncbi:MAG: ATP-binding protein [candidate division Zixibacteria bacterium]|nr:ATP-binding protein [candidate division Zixibacteria bacterium]MDH3936271.1 ATP-binding protein [candidate division Zixibacteria bacterium]MDH4033646.1 ATP-binding protein [candidate division Zixibacteria bacterium]